MSNFPSSPGVNSSEIDNTFQNSQPVKPGAAIIGPTVKGPVELPTTVTSYSDYVNRFGDVLVSGSNTYSYFTSISAYNYFKSGGKSLLVTRVVSGSYTAATSSQIDNSLTSVVGNTSSISINASASFVANSTASWTGFQVKTSTNDFWIVPNNQSYISYNTLTDMYYTSSGATTNDSYDNYINAVVSTINDPAADFKTLGLTASYSSPTLIIKSISGGVDLNGVGIYKDSYPGANGTLIGSLSGGTANVLGSALVLETLGKGIIMNNSGTLNSDGTLVSGSKDNVRWEITNANTASGTFNVIVRQGNDKTNSKLVLEAWNNVNLDPNSPRFISKVIGDQVLEYSPVSNQIDISSGTFPNQSRYIRVKSISNLTPNYLNNSGNPVAAYTASIPINGSGSFGSATGDVKANAKFYENISSTNTQGLVAANYTNMVNLLSNVNDYQFNILSTPGLYNTDYTSTITNIITNTQNRGDNLYIVDLVNYDGGLTDVVGEAQSRDTSYAASYWPWVRIQDPATGKQVFVPASTLIPGVLAFSDKVSAPWFAPAGINRGGLSTVLRTKTKLSQSDKNILYENNINPLATLPKTGVSVFGQKTLQKGASALDRINVRRLLIELKSYISQLADALVFDQNTQTTRNNFIAKVKPYLESIQQKQGLYAFQIIMDDTINTPDIIDRNQLVGQISIQPTRTVEFVALDFILEPTSGATFG